MQIGGFADKALAVNLGIFGAPQNVVHRNIIKIGEAYQRLGWYVALFCFIIGICALTAENVVSDLFLCEHFAFTKVFQFVHIITLHFVEYK